MRSLLLSFLVLLCSIQIAFCDELFVDYEPDSIKSPISTNIKNVQVQQQQFKTTVSERAPDLPKHLQNDKNTSGGGQNIQLRKTVEIKKSTKFELVCSQNFSDRVKENAPIKFTTNKNQAAGTLILPSGTVFVGHVEASHPAQLTSNGGLVKLVIDEIIYDNVSNDINSKILSQNGKHVFFNSLKGQRMYLSNVAKDTKWGRTVCRKSYITTSKLYKKGGIFLILSPIPAVFGTGICAANFVAAPVIAIFQKGGSLSVKKGTIFKIKLKEDARIYVL